MDWKSLILFGWDATQVSYFVNKKDDDMSRLDEALVRYFISSLTCNASDDTKNLILNPNELDLSGGSLNLQIIEFCRNTIEGASDGESIAETKTDLHDVAGHTHKYKIIKPISTFELDRILPDCLNSHYAADELHLDQVDTLTSVINAFCHPDIICQIRNKFLN